VAPELIPTQLDDEALARLDALARLHRIPREQMVARVFLSGLLSEEERRDVRLPGTNSASWRRLVICGGALV
jgi:hypothetical protein